VINAIRIEKNASTGAEACPSRARLWYAIC